MQNLAKRIRGAVAVAICFAAHAGAWSQEASDLIRTLVEELRVSGNLTVHAQPIASRELLPRIYENREFAPAWNTLRQIDGLLEIIDESYREGLDPSDYHVEALRAARGTLADPAGLAPRDRAELDILLTDSIVRLGYHLRFGKVDSSALDPNWTSTRELFREDPAASIQTAIDSPSLREFAARAIPRHFLYQRFKNALAEY